MFWDLVRQFALFLLGLGVGLFLIFVISRLVFSAYFQIKTEYMKTMFNSESQKEIDDGCEQKDE